MVEVLPQPVCEIALGGLRPLGIDLPGGVPPLAQPLMPDRFARGHFSPRYESSAGCGGTKMTLPSRPSTASPGITLALPIRIGMLMPIIVELSFSPS